VRNVLVVILALGSGLACTSHDSAPAVAEEPPPLVVEPPQGEPPPPEEPEPQCPPGTERHERGGEEPDALDWWCARDGVRHGPFFRSDFDLRRRTWYGVHGEHVDGELHGPVDSEGSYDVVEYGRLRVFRREVYDHGRLLRSNEAHARVALGAAAPTVTRRFAVEASGLTPTAGRQGAPAAIGTFDVEVASAWGDAPAGAPPSVLRVELSLSPTDAPTRANALLHPAADPDPPETDSRLPFGHVPTVSAPWLACDIDGCEHELVVTLRWLPSRRGRLAAEITVRAVPATWPESAPLDVRALDP
jgi:hypothetical protein